MEPGEAKFLTGDLAQHIIVMSLTAAIGFVALFVVDLVDMLFISMLGVDELAAAVGFAGTILFMTTSVSIGLGIAGGVLVARALGEGAADRARELLSNVLVVGVAFAIVFASFVYANLDGLTAWIGATGVTQTLAISYLRVLVPTMPILMIGIVCSAALRSHGAAKISMWVTIVAGLVNAVVDPILIFGFDMGLQGAAWASVLARVSMASLAVWMILRRFGGFRLPSAAAIGRDLGPIAALAIPAILTNVATPFGNAFVTKAAADFGEYAVAGMAIIGRLTPIAFALLFAMSGSIGPIIGQNFGAGRHDRVRAAFNRSMFLIVIYVVPVVVVLHFLKVPIASMFNAQGAARDLVFLFCGPLSLAWVFNGIIFVGNAAYNNLGHPFYSTWVNWGRNTLGTIPFVYLGAHYWGAEGVLIGQMAGGVLAALVSLGLAEWIMRKAERDQQFGPVRPKFPRRAAFSILHHRR